MRNRNRNRLWAGGEITPGPGPGPGPGPDPDDAPLLYVVDSDVNNDTTTPVTFMTIPLEADTEYVVEAVIEFRNHTSTTADGPVYNFVLPTGAVSRAHYKSSSSSSNVRTYTAIDGGETPQNTGNTGQDAPSATSIKSIISTDESGNLLLQFKRRDDGGDVTIKAGSVVTVREVPSVTRLESDLNTINGVFENVASVELGPNESIRGFFIGRFKPDPDGGSRFPKFKLDGLPSGGFAVISGSRNRDTTFISTHGTRYDEDVIFDVSTGTSFDGGAFEVEVIITTGGTGGTVHLQASAFQSDCDILSGSVFAYWDTVATRAPSDVSNDDSSSWVTYQSATLSPGKKYQVNCHGSWRRDGTNVAGRIRLSGAPSTQVANFFITHNEAVLKSTHVRDDTLVQTGSTLGSGTETAPPPSGFHAFLDGGSGGTILVQIQPAANNNLVALAGGMLSFEEVVEP